MSARLFQRLAEWLGVPSTSAADGATWRLESAWSWPPWATFLLVLTAVAFTAMLYARESTSAGRAYRVLLTALRCAAIGLILIMLAQWALSVRLTGPPAIVLMIDRSASMTIADQYQARELPDWIRERLVASGLSEPTRLNFAKLLATADDAKLLKTLAERWRLHVYFAAAEIEHVTMSDDAATLQRTVQDLSADGPGAGSTRLGDAVQHVLREFRGAPPAAIVLFTDGVTNAGLPLADAAQEARRAGVPIFAVGLGSRQAPRDVELADVLVDEAVFVNDLVSLQVQIKATGLDAQPATVTLRREGEQQVIAEEPITLPPSGQTVSVRLVDRPTSPGEVSYVVEVAPRDDEMNKQNNRLSRKVAVRDEKIRVLMVQGYPSYEYRFLKSLLERDRTIQLFTYLQDADPEYAPQDKTALPRLPVNRDELFKCDALILGDIDPRLVSPSFWQHVRAFVTEKGGGVAFVAGPRFFPWRYGDISDISALLPFNNVANTLNPPGQLPSEISRGFLVQPTPLGIQHPAFQLGNTPTETQRIWQTLAPLYWLYECQDWKPGAHVLAKGANFPVISFQYVGAGRVLFHAIDSTWRWRQGAGDAYFARYWVQSIRFLARGKLTRGGGVQLTSDRREYSPGEPVELRIRFLDTGLSPTNEASLVAESPGKTRRRLTLHRNPGPQSVFAATFTDFAPGEYNITLTEPQIPGNPPSIRIKVVEQSLELARFMMDAAALTEAAQTTRGKFYTIASAGQLLSDLPAGRRVPIENLPPVSIWNRWWLLAAFLTCITTEWILRKRKGML